ncbi:DUF1272 domain-containing protein [Pseudocolwellia sp. HL-MZ19]|uniref:DUF1272 domain-containing protein n=1 Tax=unclassified Pseudocolwellia TaxID=2848178 RepID=UPI003CEC19C0
MLELHPNCENCDKDLPPESTEACICSYECTFCTACVEGILQNVCPNCGGGFSARPIRPAKELRNGVGLQHQPASTKRVRTVLTETEIIEFAASVKDTQPENR